MTQVELLVTLGVMILVMGIYFTSTLFFQKQQQHQVEAIEGTTEVLSFLQNLKRDLGAAGTISAAAGSSSFTLTQNLTSGPTSVTYQITSGHSNCGGGSRKPFNCTQIRRNDGVSSILVAQPLRFEWCVPQPAPASGPDCAALNTISGPGAATTAPRRFSGRIEIPRETGGGNLTIPFVFTLEGMPWGARQARLIRLN